MKYFYTIVIGFTLGVMLSGCSSKRQLMKDCEFLHTGYWTCKKP